MPLTEKEAREVRAFARVWWVSIGLAIGGFSSLIAWAISAAYSGESFAAAVGISAAGMGLGLFLMICGVCTLVTRDQMED